MERKLREELNSLSKQVFGTSSRWKKIIDHGVAESFERDREVMVPDNKGGLKKKIFTDRKSVVKHYSLEEVRKLMEDILESRKPKVIEALAPESQEKLS